MTKLTKATILNAGTTRWSGYGGYIDGEYFTIENISEAVSVSVHNLERQRIARRSLKRSVLNKPIRGKLDPDRAPPSDPKVQAMTKVLTSSWKRQDPDPEPNDHAVEL